MWSESWIWSWNTYQCSFNLQGVVLPLTQHVIQFPGSSLNLILGPATFSNLCFHFYFISTFPCNGSSNATPLPLVSPLITSHLWCDTNLAFEPSILLHFSFLSKKLTFLFFFITTTILIASNELEYTSSSHLFAKIIIIICYTIQYRHTYTHNTSIIIISFLFIHTLMTTQQNTKNLSKTCTSNTCVCVYMCYHHSRRQEYNISVMNRTCTYFPLNQAKCFIFFSLFINASPLHSTLKPSTVLGVYTVGTDFCKIYKLLCMKRTLKKSVWVPLIVYYCVYLCICIACSLTTVSLMNVQKNIKSKQKIRCTGDLSCVGTHKIKW